MEGRREHKSKGKQQMGISHIKWEEEIPCRPNWPQKGRKLSQKSDSGQSQRRGGTHSPPKAGEERRTQRYLRRQWSEELMISSQLSCISLRTFKSCNTQYHASVKTPRNSQFTSMPPIFLVLTYLDSNWWKFWNLLSMVLLLAPTWRLNQVWYHDSLLVENHTGCGQNC